MATLQSVRLGPQGRPQNGTSLKLQVKISRIRMLGRANTARFDFNIRLEMGTVAITLPTSLGSDCSYMWRNFVHGRRDCVQCCGSHSGHILLILVGLKRTWIRSCRLNW